MLAACWWLIQKDLRSEFRARHAWTAMLLHGLVVVLVFSLQVELLPHQKQRLVGGLLWLAVFLAGASVMDRAISSEREDGCWDGLRLMPIGPGCLFLCKWAVNTVALWLLAAAMIPLFFFLSDLALAPHALWLALVGAVTIPGIAAVGTLASALGMCGSRGGGLFVLVVLPLVLPLLLGAAECTRLLVEGSGDAQWWRWLQMLGAGTVLFTAAGNLLFEYAVEE